MTKKISKKDKIYIAAAKLFKKNGYQATSMRQLAKEVGLEASSLYSHISSKQEILSQICLNEANKFQDNLNLILTEEGDVFDLLRKISYFHIEMALEDPMSVTVFNDEWRHLEEPTISQFRSKRKAYEKQILDIIERGIDEDVIIKGDSFVLYQTFLSSFKWLYLWYRPGREIDKNSLKADIAGVILRGLRK